MMNYGISTLNAASKPTDAYQKRRDAVAAGVRQDRPRGPKWSETIFESKIEAMAYGLFALQARQTQSGYQIDVNMRLEAELANLDYDKLIAAFHSLHARGILLIYVDPIRPEQIMIADFGQVPSSVNIDSDRLTAVCAYVRQREGKYYE